MKKSEAVFFGGTALFCAAYLAAAARMPLGSFQEPGPALVPVLLGAVGLAISLGLCLRPLLLRAIVRSEGVPRAALLRLLGYILSVAVYAGASEIVGAYAGIFIMMVALSKISGLSGWRNPLLLAGLSSVVAFLLFDLALGVPLPRGFFAGGF